MHLGGICSTVQMSKETHYLMLYLKAHYPKGSYTFGHSPEGGFSFYATGPDNFNLENAKEATLSYSVYFEDGFDFQKGGKLPGFCEY